MMKCTPLFLVILVAFIPLIFADDSSFETVLGNDGDGRIDGVGYFNAENMAEPTQSSTFGQPISGDFDTMPLVSDLDNDGVFEVITVDDDGTVTISKGYDLTFNMSNDMGTGTRMLIADIGADGTKDIITYDTTSIQWGQYNGSHLFYVDSLAFGCRNVICRDDDGVCICLRDGSVTCDGVGPTYDSGSFYISAFNNTDFTTTTFTGASYQLYCWPYYQGGGTEEYNGSGQKEFYTSYNIFSSTGNRFYAGVFSVNPDTLFTQNIDTLGSFEGYYSGTNTCFEGDTTRTCGASAPYYTQATLGLHDSDATRDVAIAGYVGTADQFKLYVYDGDGSKSSHLDQYPELGLGYANGVKLSNPFFGDFLPDTNERDVCVVGYDYYNGDGEKVINLLCGSETRTIALEDHNIYEYDISGASFNISGYDNSYAYGTDQKYEVEREAVLMSYYDVNEIVTPYGIFSLEYSGVNRLEREYPLDYGNGGVTLTDLNNISRLQILGYTENMVYLINDKFVNSQAYFWNVTVDPCVTGPWAFNTSTAFFIQVKDAELNTVSARVQLYYGTTNEIDSGWSENVSTALGIGNIYFSGLRANLSTSASTIRISIRDTEQNFATDPATKEIPFSVVSGNATGWTLGDCVTVIQGVEPEVPQVDPDEFDCVYDYECVDEYDETYFCRNGFCVTDTTPGGGINTGLNEIKNWTGVSPTLIFLMFLCTVIVSIFIYSPSGVPMSAIFGGSLFVMVLGLIIGAKLGLLGVGTIVIIGLLLVIVASIMVSSAFMGRGSGS